MALPRKIEQPNPGQITPILAVPHVSSDTLGGYRPPISTPLTSSDCNEPLNKVGPTPENSSPNVVRPPEIAPQTATDLQIGQPQEAKIEGSERVSLPEFKVRTDLGPQKSGVGHALLSEIYNQQDPSGQPAWGSETDMGATALAPVYPQLITVRHAFKARIVPAAQAGKFPALLDDLHAALQDTVQLRWGFHRVTTRMVLAPAPYRGAPEHVETKLVGQSTATTPELMALRDADYFAADVAFLEFLDGAARVCETAGFLAEASHAEERRDTRVLACSETFKALAKEAADIYAALTKADAINAAGGWPAEKVDAVEKKLRILAARLNPIVYVLDRWRPDLLPAATSEGEVAA